jgi:Na+/H+ antiporter NhaD/arsenite permease-like protein
VTAVLSALLDNVTTVLLIAPITLLISDELNLTPYPFLVSQILASNIGGAATLIGDPPNIMIGSAVGLSFMDFLLNVGPVMPVVMVATFIILKFIYGKNLKVSADRRERIMQFREADAIEDWVLLKKCLLILTAVIAGFVLQEFTHVEPATTALFGAALLLLISGEELHDVMGKVEWTTIFFFIGLFIVVHGMVEVGLISMLANLMLKLTGDGIGTAVYLTLWVSAIASALVDNIPFVATMIPLIKDMGPSLGGDQAIMPLWWALSIGACLGGNGSIIGASANVIVAGFAARSGYPIGFFRFMKLAFPLMLMSIVISTVYIYLRFL